MSRQGAVEAEAIVETAKEIVGTAISTSIDVAEFALEQTKRGVGVVSRRWVISTILTVAGAGLTLAAKSSADNSRPYPDEKGAVKAYQALAVVSAVPTTVIAVPTFVGAGRAAVRALVGLASREPTKQAAPEDTGVDVKTRYTE